MTEGVSEIFDAAQWDEAVEGRDALLEKREPDWAPLPWQF